MKTTRFNDYFTWRYNKQTHFGDWKELSDYDKEVYKNVPLKRNEYLMRYNTEKMRSPWGDNAYYQTPLIKVNPVKQLIYFLDSENENDTALFETRGVKAKIWLNPEWEWTPTEYLQLV
mgnify:CR=1 FL=1|jgi:hypothetical protein|tara:strand:+ start:68 stop:421 length:354 start_codon:yes stop_codon:yes gene_type:complete